MENTVSEFSYAKPTDFLQNFSATKASILGAWVPSLESDQTSREVLRAFREDNVFLLSALLKPSEFLNLPIKFMVGEASWILALKEGMVRLLWKFHAEVAHQQLTWLLKERGSPSVEKAFAQESKRILEAALRELNEGKEALFAKKDFHTEGNHDQRKELKILAETAVKEAAEAFCVWEINAERTLEILERRYLQFDYCRGVDATTFQASWPRWQELKLNLADREKRYWNTPCVKNIRTKTTTMILP